MASLLRWVMRTGKRPPSPPHRFPKANLSPLDGSQPIEEELFTHYSPLLFRSVSIGEVLHERYQVVGKLGYGSNSTVWLCRDLSAHRYVTVKVCNDNSSEREIKAYEYLNTIQTDHPGRSFVRTMEDHFTLTSGSANFPCIVHEPLSINFRQLRHRLRNQRFPVYVLKPALVQIFLALDFLHTEARLIHTDLQEKNIILGLEEDSVLKAFEREEQQNPSPRKISQGREVYPTRQLQMPKKHGQPIITDFGEARFGESEYNEDIQPFQYRAPEVIFQVPWTDKVDIWNVGVLIWDLFEGKNLFEVEGPDGEDSTPHHVAHMIALVGHPPSDLLKRSPRTHEFFDTEGNWIGTDAIPTTSLEELEENLEGEEQARFLTFLRRMLTWNAADRPSAKELLQDPWLSKR